MKNRISIFYIVIVLLIISALIINHRFEPKDPKDIIYMKLVSETDSTEVWKTIKYELTNIKTDTIHKKKRIKSTLEL